MSQSLVFQAISGVEPAPEAYEASVLPLHHIAIVTMAGVEPARRVYETPMLPLHHIVYTEECTSRTQWPQQCQGAFIPIYLPKRDITQSETVG